MDLTRRIIRENPIEYYRNVSHFCPLPSLEMTDKQRRCIYLMLQNAWYIYEIIKLVLWGEQNFIRVIFAVLVIIISLICGTNFRDMTSRKRHFIPQG